MRSIFSQFSFRPLPGTADEARVLQTLFAQRNYIDTSQATKGAIKHHTTPSILHIATHPTDSFSKMLSYPLHQQQSGDCL